MRNLILAFLLMVAVVSQAHAASFDCDKARTADEITVCGQRDLSVMDDRLAALYRRTLDGSDSSLRERVVRAQRHWLAERSDCGSDARCLATSYKTQIARLKSALAPQEGALSSAARRFRRSGQCDDCDLKGAVLSFMRPAEQTDGGKALCTIEAVASGDFTGAKIDHADFITCRTKYDSALASMSWEGAILRQADFTDTDLGGNSFAGADLTGANLSDADLYLVNMRDVTARSAVLVGATSRQANMSGAGGDFVDAVFEGADLEGANLFGDFQGADFTGADLKGATISGFAMGARGIDADAQALMAGEPDRDGRVQPPARFGGKVNLTGADLRGARFFGQTAMTPGGFSGAILCGTVLPDGSRSDRDCAQ